MQRAKSSDRRKFVYLTLVSFEHLDLLAVFGG